MARFSLRSTLLAGAFALVAAPSLAQVMEVAIDQSPAGLDPHIITAFASFMVVNGTIYEGLTAVDKDLRLNPGVADPGPSRPTARPIPSRSTPG